jgi:hypothetical protein
MTRIRAGRRIASGLALGVALFLGTAQAQGPVILSGDELSKVVPSNFYFEGQIGPTQMRNAAAVRFGANHHFVAALVDTSGYASGIRSKYEGLLIADAKVSLGGTELGIGAYGFGVTEDGKMNIFDIGGNRLHTIAAPRDAQLQSPRPLAIVKSGNELRLYRGRNYVVLAFK